MSHLACADKPDHPLNDSRSGMFREIRALFRGVPGLARQFGRHFPRRAPPISTWCAPASRSTAAIRRRAAESDEAGRRLEGARHAGARGRVGETVGYGATWTAKRPTPARDRRGRLCRWLPARRRRVRRTSRRATSIVAAALPARRPRLDGPDRGRHHRPACGASARGDFATLIGGGHDRRRGRRRLPAPSATRSTRLGRRYTGSSEAAADDSGAGHDAPIARHARQLRLPELRRRLWPLAGQVRLLRRMEHDRRGRPATPPAGRARACGRARAGVRARAARRRDAGRAAPRHRGIAEFDRVTGGGFCAARCCCSAAIPASASRRC